MIRVIPYVEDRRNCLLFEPVALAPTAGLIASLQAALKTAIQVCYQIEDTELAAEPLPDEKNRRLILLYEAAEGGAGALRRLVDDPLALGEVAREALRLCHFDPDTGADRRRGPRSREDCEAACYDCLMSYTNQPDHPILDRQGVRNFLQRLSVSKVGSSPTGLTRAEQRARLEALCDSDLERQWLDVVERSGHRLPSTAQRLIEECHTRPDFLYEEQFTAVYVDGPHHDYPERHARDRAQMTCLEDLGYTVLRFPAHADWPAILAAAPGTFGPGRGR